MSKDNSQRDQNRAARLNAKKSAVAAFQDTYAAIVAANEHTNLTEEQVAFDAVVEGVAAFTKKYKECRDEKGVAGQSESVAA